MFSSKIVSRLSRCLATKRIVPDRVARLPAFCSFVNSSTPRYYSDDSSGKFIKPDKYKVFKDDDSSIILDVEEERALLDSQIIDEDLDEEVDKFAGLNTSRE